MTGILTSPNCGVFRKNPVHVGDPDVYFPPSKLLPEMMKSFCDNFPNIPQISVTQDPILTAAEVSYGFVRIHPYSDGNGRLSRLLMNLVLWGNFPPVYIKADTKGRKRYGYALRRANRGDINALAALIAMSLISIYDNCSFAKLR